MRLLRRDDPAQGVTAGEDDASMIDLGGRKRRRQKQSLAVEERPSAGRTPIEFDTGHQDGVALRTDTFHEIRVHGQPA